MKRWKHRIGDCVDHIAGKMRAIVLGRARTLAGVETYNVRLLDLKDGRRDRVVRGDFMAHVKFDKAKCLGCRFMFGGKCRRNVG